MYSYINVSDQNPPASLVISNLTKRYSGSDKLAVDDVSLVVKPGEVYGFLGPNGAGKTTTIRLLMNFINPTGGTATILGKDIVNDSVAIKRSVGYLSGDFAVYPKMTGRQYLMYMSQLQPAKAVYTRELANRLKADLSTRLGNLSRGNRQKIGIIQAFMHEPKVLILDEPTSGLDPLMQEVFYELIDEAKQRGAAVFASSHILSEVQKMCDRVGIIREGKLVEERVMADMVKDAAQTFDISFAGDVPLKALKNIGGSHVSAHKDQAVTIHIHGQLAPLFAVLAKSDVVKIDARNLDLEELFMSYYQSKGEDESRN